MSETSSGHLSCLPRARVGRPSEKTQRRRALTSDIIASVMETGLGDFVLRDVAVRLGTSSRMLLYYFGSKEQMILAVVDQINVELAAARASYAPPPKASLGQVLDLNLAALRDPSVGPLVGLWVEILVKGGRGEAPYAAIARDEIMKWVGMIEDDQPEMNHAAQSGRALALIALVKGALMLERILPGSTVGLGHYLVPLLDGERVH